jgi:hypothetical protein
LSLAGMQGPSDMPTIMEQCTLEQDYIRDGQTRTLLYTYVSFNRKHQDAHEMCK